MSSALRQSIVGPCQSVVGSRGFTLIELLVALLVLAIALLGLAGLQSVAVQENRGALLRTQALVSAQEILDRMRSNRTQALASAYQTTLAQAASNYTACSPCATASAAAVNDLRQWKLGLEQQLPNGQGAIRTPGTNLFEVTVRWSEQDLAPGANGEQERAFVTREVVIVSEL